MIARGTFVGGSAAGLAAVTSAPADSQSGFGHPHPPLVAENDPAITVVRTTLQRPDTTISAYVAMPKTVVATTPGIVMSAHIWGIDAEYRDLARRFAKAGYIAIAPGIFDRTGQPSGDGLSDASAMAPYVAALYAGNKMNGDFLAAKAWVRGRASRGKAGMYGNCMGGGMVLQALAGNSDYDAACVLYGYVRADRKMSEPPPDGAFDWATHVTTPVLGVYAANDGGINPLDAQAAFAKLAGPHDLTIEPDVPHAFLDDTRPSYRPAAAADAWTKMMAWYGEYLAAP